MNLSLLFERARFRILALTLAIWLALTLIPVAPPALAQPAAPPLDLAALVLMPADLEADGMSGHGLGEGRSFTTVEEMMAADPSSFSRGAISLMYVPGAETTLRDAGWQRLHELELPSPDPAAPEEYRALVVSGVEEYATPDGAAAAFAALTTQQALEDGIPGRIEVLSASTPIGEQSAVWRNASTTEDIGSAAQAITVSVRTGSRIVNVSIVNFTDPAPPDQVRAERLAGTLTARVQAAQASPAQPTCLPTATGIRALDNERASAAAGVPVPGLGFCAQRLSGDGVAPVWARYTTIDGVALPFWTDTPEGIAEEQEFVDTAGIRDTYELQSRLEGPGDPNFYTVSITRYVDADAAATRFAGLEERLRGNSEFTLEQFEPGTPDVTGDAVSYIQRHNENGRYYTYSLTLIGDTLVVVWVSMADRPVPETVQSLLQSQVACMQAGACLDPVPLPPEIAASAPAA